MFVTLIREERRTGSVRCRVERLGESWVPKMVVESDKEVLASIPAFRRSEYMRTGYLRKPNSFSGLIPEGKGLGV